MLMISKPFCLHSAWLYNISLVYGYQMNFDLFCKYEVIDVIVYFTRSSYKYQDNSLENVLSN